MASRQFVTNVGQDLRSLATSFQIAGIKIDNPSGSWLHVTGIEKYVPPYTLAWSYPVNPTQLNIDVLFTTSPTGSPSELVGGPIVVELWDEELGASSGIASGAEQAQKPFGAALQLATNLAGIANEAGTTTTILTPTAGSRIVPVTFVAALTSNGSPPFDPYFGQISIRVVSGAGVTLLPLMAISPESPESTHDFPAGTKLGVGDVMRVYGQTYAGGGRTEFGASVLYYEQVG